MQQTTATKFSKPASSPFKAKGLLEPVPATARQRRGSSWRFASPSQSNTNTCKRKLNIIRLLPGIKQRM